MFFMMSVTDGRKDLEYAGTVTVCDSCGRYGRMNVFMTYTVLALFFIPVLKWNRRYFVQMSCCGQTYALDPEIGRSIAAGENVQIRPEDLKDIGGSASAWKVCSNCGYRTDEDFDFCPKCGGRL